MSCWSGAGHGCARSLYGLTGREWYRSLCRAIVAVGSRRRQRGCRRPLGAREGEGAQETVLCALCEKCLTLLLLLLLFCFLQLCAGCARTMHYPVASWLLVSWCGVVCCCFVLLCCRLRLPLHRHRGRAPAIQGRYERRQATQCECPAPEHRREGGRLDGMLVDDGTRSQNQMAW